MAVEEGSRSNRTNLSTARSRMKAAAAAAATATDPRGRPSSSSSSSGGLGVELMQGARITVYWPGEDCWYHATVMGHPTRPMKPNKKEGTTTTETKHDHTHTHTNNNNNNKRKVHYDLGSAEDLEETMEQEWHILSRSRLEKDLQFRKEKQNRVEQLKVGTRLSLFWPLEDVHFQGTLQEIKTTPKKNDFSMTCSSMGNSAATNPTTTTTAAAAAAATTPTTTNSYDPFQDADAKPHLIQYDDGDVEWTNLYFRKFHKVPTKARTLQVGTRIALWDEATKQRCQGSILKIETKRRCPHQVLLDKEQLPHSQQTKKKQKTKWFNLNVQSFQVLAKKKAPSSTKTPSSKDKVPTPTTTERQRTTLQKSMSHSNNHNNNKTTTKTTTTTMTSTPQEHSTKKQGMQPKSVRKEARLKSPQRAKAPAVPPTPKLVPKRKPACPVPQHRGGPASLGNNNKPQKETTTVAAALACAAPPIPVFHEQEIKTGKDLREKTSATTTTTEGSRHSHQDVLPVMELRPLILRKRKREFLQDLKESDIGQGWKLARIQAKKEEDNQKHQPLLAPQDKLSTILIDHNKRSSCCICFNPCLEHSLQATKCQHCFCHACAQLYFSNGVGNIISSKNKKQIPMKDEYYRCPKCKAPITPLVVKSAEALTMATTNTTITTANLWFPHLATSKHASPSRKTLVRVLQQVQALRCDGGGDSGGQRGPSHAPRNKKVP